MLYRAVTKQTGAFQRTIDVMQTFNETSMTLLAQVRANQADAWDRLVELYAPLIQYWCRRSDLRDEDTADVFQEVFRSVATNIEKFRRDRSGDTFRGWLRTITSNKIRDHFRRVSGKATAEGGSVAQMRIADLADPVPNEEDSSELDILRKSVHRMMEWIRGDFEEKTWEAFWQCQVEERSTQDIAEQLQMTPAAVRKAKYRVLRRLKEELDGLLD
ncbi:MAG: RNA polymerase sigma-70 factor (ECF subfamily) [Pirellulaceae bacterium]